MPAWLTLLPLTILFASQHPPSLEETRSAARLPLRIGLIRTCASLNQCTVRVPETMRLRGGDGNQLASGPGEWSFMIAESAIQVDTGEGTAVSGSRFLLSSLTDDPDAQFTITANGKPRSYRGGLEISMDATGNRLKLVNLVKLESYLRGVVPAEIPSGAPMEALKAQSIAARTYAMKCRGRFKSQGYDLTDASDSQIYNGSDAEKQSTDRAISDTAGMVLTYKGDLIWADYNEDCGGVTASGEHDSDYPQSVSDSPGDGRPDYCASGPYHTWILTISLDDIAKRMNQPTRALVGSVVSVEVVDIDASGRARRVKINGTQGSKLMKGSQFRSLVGTERLRSTLFTVSDAGYGELIFEGRGWGHGHGFCQRGAMGMASAPYNKSCAEILEHYFPGSILVSLTGELSGR